MIGLVIGFLLLAVRIGLSGWAWAGSIFLPPDSSPAEKTVLKAARLLLAGLMANLLPMLLLSAFGAWTPLMDWLIWAVLIVVGFGWRLIGRSGEKVFSETAWPAVLLLLVTMIPVLLPLRSEWLAGGWDPGIYQNNSVVIARHNGIQPGRHSVYAGMSTEERRLFTRTGGAGDYHEAFPSVPVEIEDGSLSLYFFHLTPMCGALFYRLGGMDLLLRLPMVLGFWGLLPFLALLLQAGLRRWRLAAGLAAALLSSLWWYQQAIPTSEMMYYLLIGSALWLYVEAFENNQKWPLLLMITLFAATANHLNFAALSVIMLVAASLAEAIKGRADRWSRLGWSFAAVGLGILWNLESAAITIRRLEGKDDALTVVLMIYAFGVLAGLSVAALPRYVRRLGCISGLWSTAGAAAALAIITIAFASMSTWLEALLVRGFSVFPDAKSILTTLMTLSAFSGGPWCALAGAGLLSAALDRSGKRPVIRVLATALGLGLLALVANPGISPLYPWAIRRFFPVFVLLMALGQVLAIDRLVVNFSSRPLIIRCGAALLLLVAVYGGASKVREAFSVGDYLGMRSGLDKIDAVFRETDIVVADDPRWGTPLMLAYGRDVINGELLWKSEDPDYQVRFVEALRRLSANNSRRVVWLTSSERGVSIYPVAIGEAKMLGEPHHLSYRNVVHSSRARSYATEEKRKVLALYAWN